ncbi:MAG: hypothetical protein ACM3XS_05845, partial [Bacteroidota bacterium]
MGTPEYRSSAAIEDDLEDLRREIGALREELAREPAPAEDGYREATLLDLLVSRFLRLQNAAS